jgi:hypothetical protein
MLCFAGSGVPTDLASKVSSKWSEAVSLIHSWFQPGVANSKLDGNRLNGIHILEYPRAFKRAEHATA